MSLREIFRVEALPILQNRTFQTQATALAAPTGDVVLVQDTQTGLIFNVAVESHKLIYDDNYQNEQAHSGFFQDHLSVVANLIRQYFPEQSLLEVGCGKGFFLEYLQSAGFNIKGIDPAYDGNNPNVIKAPFTKECGMQAEGIILRHVLEHMEDPVSFLASIADANAGAGRIYIEVPCFDWIREHRAWFDIFYEHINYFRLVDFNRMFGTVLESGRIFGGQYLYVIAELSSLRKPVNDEVSPAGLPADFLQSIERISSLVNGKKKAAVWGAASKGVIFSVYLKRLGINLDLAIDINPQKQGCYLPCSGLKVESPLEAMMTLKKDDHVFVMNPNYLQEIVQQSNNQYHYLKVDHE